MMTLELPLQGWLLGACAALLIGFSKTGVPGTGILVVPLMALVFNTRDTVGTTLLLLIAADVFAVAWYRQHTRWDKLLALLPWVAVGMVAGIVALFLIGEDVSGRDQINIAIGALVLVMVGVHFARQRWQAQLNPEMGWARAAVGGMAGFATAVSNAAAPIMSVYLTSLKLPKHEFVGTTAWYFLILNVSKVPFYALLTWLLPERPMFTWRGVVFDAVMLPLVVLGAFVGRWALPHIPQRTFNAVVVGLAAIAAVRLIVA